jgi:two-component system, NarL family, nitrate/nitrite response regulator NarL
MTVQTPVRVAVIDDHPLYCKGVARTLKSSAMLNLVGMGGSCDDAVRIAKEAAPDVMLLDIQLPGGGLEAARLIAELDARPRIIFLTASESNDHVATALSTGASGYVLKRTTGSELVDIVMAVYNGDTYVTPDLAARMLRNITETAKEPKPDRNPFMLTPREEDILDGVAEGQTNKEIAFRFNIGEKTVKQYMTNIMHKLQVRNRVEAALKARGRHTGAPKR